MSNKSINRICVAFTIVLFLFAGRDLFSEKNEKSISYEDEAILEDTAKVPPKSPGGKQSPGVNQKEGKMMAIKRIENSVSKSGEDSGESPLAAVENNPAIEEPDKPAEQVTETIAEKPSSEVIVKVEEIIKEERPPRDIADTAGLLPVEAEVEGPSETSLAVPGKHLSEELDEGVEIDLLPGDREDDSEMPTPVLPDKEDGIAMTASLPAETEEKPSEESSVKTGTVQEEVAAVENAPEDNREKIVLLPLENLTDEIDILKHVSPVLAYRLEKKGLKVLYGDNINNYICKERIRSSGLVSKELAVKLKEEFGAIAIVTGSIVSYSTDDDPKFGVLVRVIDSSSGAILWADYASATGEDFTTILGLGTIKSIHSLVPRVIDKLLASFTAEKLHEEKKSARKVVVMPFQNNTLYRNSGKIVMYMFLVELLKNKEFEPIEYGNTREQIINLRIRHRGELDYESVNALSGPLVADGIVLGVVDSYLNKIDDTTSPKVGITARLIDSSNNRIIWYNSHQLNGEDEVIALGWGRIKSVHKVAQKLVAWLVNDMGAAKWKK